jgi:C4-dicarboxylate-specific signal transduction histidine kinase
LPVCFAGAAIVAVTLVTISNLRARTVEQAGIATGRAAADQVVTLRNFYTAEVVSRATKAGMGVNFDFADTENVLPLPATLVKALGKQMAEEYPGSDLRLLSNYPFRNRAQIKLDEFERSALAALERNPRTPVHRIEKLNGRLSARYAVADIMKPGCVACHNSHPLSPKRDWKVGDVRGMVEVVVPIDEMDAGISASAATIGYTAMGGFGLLAFVVWIVARTLRRELGGEPSYAAEIAAKVSGGNLTEQIVTSRDDSSSLLYAMKSMVAALQTAHGELEERVAGRTEELANSLSLLNSTLNSTADGILAIQSPGRVVCTNELFKAMWSLPPELAAEDNVNLVIDHMAARITRIKEAARFRRRFHDSVSSPQNESFGLIELIDGRIFEYHTRPRWVEGQAVGLVADFRDITDRKRAEVELENANQRLIDASRLAGMAEVASSVLHNVGNVLNSVNVSATLVADGLAKSKIAGLAKAVALMREHESDLAGFFGEDSRGKQLLTYLAQLSEHLRADQETSVRELDSLRKNVGHIKEIVAMQQSYAGISAVEEVLDAAELVEDSLRMDLVALKRQGIEVIRDFDEVPTIRCDRHKVLQILVNLVRNAVHACSASGRTDKRLTLRIKQHSDRLWIVVEDNGTGISAENLSRIFSYGFTTKKGGHGFGLHGAALAAKEMHGSLRVHSEGAGLGASFILDLPLTSREEREGERSIAEFHSTSSNE